MCLVGPGFLASTRSRTSDSWLQVSTDHAELQSELRRSAQKICVLEKVTSSWSVPNMKEQLHQAVSACARPLTLFGLQELVALNKEHKEFVFAYGNLENASCNIETHLRQVSNLHGS